MTEGPGSLLNDQYFMESKAVLFFSWLTWIGGENNHGDRWELTWPMADSGFKLFGIPYFVGKIKFKLLFQGPLAK